MKVLIVSNQPNNKIANGGNLCNERNRLYFERYFGKDNVFNYEIQRQKTKFYHLLNSVKRILFGANKNDVKTISKIIKAQNIDILFFSNTFNGDLIYKFRNKKIIVFAHNVEYLFVKQEIGEYNFIKKGIYKSKLFVTKRNEKKSVLYSDLFFTLNKRDSLEFDNIYGTFEKKLLPMSIKDNYITDNDSEKKSGIPQDYMLFVGFSFFGNTEGLFWFIKNVLDFVPYKLIVCGYGMEKYNNSFPDKNVVFNGYVDNLNDYYKNASLVIMPIISGSGMKTKTAEAMMYGKYIIGTDEAFCGYDVDVKKIGALCNSKEEFINAINKFHFEKHSLYNEYSRKLFEEKYSDEQVYKLFEKYIGDFINHESLS